MDRHSTASATRVAGPTAWKCVIPVMLVLGNFQASIAQSTLRFVSDPGGSPASRTQVVAVPDAWPIVGISAQQRVAASEIRIITSSQPGQLTSSPTVASDGLRVPAPIVASPEVPSSRAPSLIASGSTPIRAEGLAQLAAEVSSEPPEPIDCPVTVVPETACPSGLSPVEAPRAVTAAASVGMKSPSESMDFAPTDQLDLAARLIVAGLKDNPAALQRVEVPVASPPTDLIEKLAPYVLAKRTPVERQPLAVAPAESRKRTENPDVFITITPTAAAPQLASRQSIAASPIEKTKATDRLVATVPATESAPEPQYAAQLPTDAPQADGPKAIGQAKSSESPVLVSEAAPSAPRPVPAKAGVAAPAREEIARQPAVSSQPPSVAANPTGAPQRPSVDTRVAVPVHVASTTHSAADNRRIIAAVPLQQPHNYRVGTASQNADRVALQEAAPVLKFPATSDATNTIAMRNESFAFADRRQPAPLLVAKEHASANGGQSMLPEVATEAPESSAGDHSVAETGSLVDRVAPRVYPAAGPKESVCPPVGCPYLPGQSGAPFVCGVDCGNYGAPCSQTLQECCIPWSLFGPGEYVGPARTEHVSTYYLRVNDLITLTFITSRRAEHYCIGCGDRLRLQYFPRTPSTSDRDRITSDKDTTLDTLDRELLVQPDGTIALPMIGEVPVAGKTVADVNNELVKLYGKYVKYESEARITVTPLEMNTATDDIIRAVTSISGSNGQTQALRVTPEGTIQAPGVGSVFAQGLTLDELSSELKARYSAAFGPGLLVSPSLTERATAYAFVGGEVKVPGRYTLEGPTTVMQAITLAGGWNVGGALHQVVVFRRDETWCLKATKIDVHAPLYGKDPCPTNDVWLRDNDLVIVPKSAILCATDVIELYFTRGVYAVFPINYVYDFTERSSITPVP